MNRIGLIFLFAFFFCKLQSQTDSVYYGTRDPEPARKKTERNSKWLDDLNYGGNFQLMFGSVTFIYLNPTIGLNVSEKLNVGIGGIYSYIGAGRDVSASMYGPQVYARYAVLENLSIIGQYNKLYQPDWNSWTPNKMVWVDYMMAGIGYTQPVGDKAMFYTNLLYNLTPHRSSIYPNNLIFQFGFNTRF